MRLLQLLCSKRLTYRLPAEYRETYKQQLIDQTLKFFDIIGQQDFNGEKLLAKGNNQSLGLSTGQSKIAILISAILYKLYLNQPVLSVLGKTLANLDTKTTKLKCNTIKDIYKDSIILSVDHQAEGNTGFYDTFIDSSQYKPQEVAIIGENIRILL